MCHLFNSSVPCPYGRSCTFVHCVQELRVGNSARDAGFDDWDEDEGDVWDGTDDWDDGNWDADAVEEEDEEASPVDWLSGRGDAPKK